ncbi:unnamed protein product [Lymnaea stagnalis]|uniref:Transmembrane protein 5 n=1 Tax=Lymnaea stagnalis TaxID=6523 RepID=A0AAV2HCL4_LYMST
MWLELLPTLPHLRNAAVVLLGSEVCDNSWIHPYMSFNGGPLKFVFLVYDSPEVDNVHFFQWPLGVATYRNFPDVRSSNLDVRSRRAHLFNFLGTIYKNSSREILLSAIKNSSYKELGLVKPRWEWLPQETEESQDEYMHALSQSDLTLNPVGINTECYRIYESMSLGAVPVVEDTMTPGHCSASRNSKKTFPAPLRLLKEYGAPVIFVKNWAEDLETLLKREKEMSDYDRLKRRENLVKWYSNFKLLMRDRLVSVTLEKFFNSRLVDR